MKELPAVFRSEGFDFKLLLRDGDVALLRKTKKGYSFETYEVVIVQKETRRRVWPDGRVTEPCERMPASEQWGVHGWSFSDIRDARRKFYELVSVSQCKAA
jgi:hypothetical protein